MTGRVTASGHQFEMLIGGQQVAASSGKWIEVVNPATEAVIGRAPDATNDDLDAVVVAAAAAFTSWRDQPIDDRRDVLRAIAGVIRDNVEELAVLLTSEQGKPLAAARAEVENAARWCTATADLKFTEISIEEDETHRVEIRQVPLGPVAAIVPWNFPVVLAFWKIAPALLTGNTIVVKPSPFTPLSMLRLGQLLRDVVPAGVVNVITGGDDLGPAMTNHPAIRKIAFTGSTATGKRVMASAAQHLTRVTLELGGNDAAVVLADVDVESVAQEIFTASFRNSAQYCLASKRVYVHDDIYDEFAAKFAELAHSARVGNGMDPGIDLGPVQNRLQYDKVVRLIEQSEQSGLDFIVRGEIPEGPGLFVYPTVIDNPPDTSAVVIEEPFGPVVPLLRFREIDELVARVNTSEYGLGAIIFGQDVELATSVARRIDSGIVWVNEIQRVTPTLPLAGHKESGFGVENGMEGLLEYTVSHVISRLK